MKKYTSEYLLDLIKKLMTAKGTEEQQTEWLNTLVDATSPDISNYVFWNDVELTAKEILEKGKNYSIVYL